MTGELPRTYRASGSVNSRDPRIEDSDLESLPGTESYEGISKIEITVYGDAPSVPFIVVEAASQEAAGKFWRHLRYSLSTADWWKGYGA